MLGVANSGKDRNNVAGMELGLLVQTLLLKKIYPSCDASYQCAAMPLSWTCQDQPFQENACAKMQVRGDATHLSTQHASRLQSTLCRGEMQMNTGHVATRMLNKLAADLHCQQELPQQREPRPVCSC
jgi:hypothetical protein